MAYDKQTQLDLHAVIDSVDRFLHAEELMCELFASWAEHRLLPPLTSSLLYSSGSLYLSFAQQM